MRSMSALKGHWYITPEHSLSRRIIQHCVKVWENNRSMSGMSRLLAEILIKCSFIQKSIFLIINANNYLYSCAVSKVVDGANEICSTSWILFKNGLKADTWKCPDKRKWKQNLHQFILIYLMNHRIIQVGKMLPPSIIYIQGSQFYKQYFLDCIVRQ